MPCRSLHLYFDIVYRMMIIPSKADQLLLIINSKVSSAVSFQHLTNVFLPLFGKGLGFHPAAILGMSKLIVHGTVLQIIDTHLINLISVSPFGVTKSNWTIIIMKSW